MSGVRESAGAGAGPRLRCHGRGGRVATGVALVPLLAALHAWTAAGTDGDAAVGGSHDRVTPAADGFGVGAASSRYHNRGEVVCADCHVSFVSGAGGLGGSAGVMSMAPATAWNPALLRESDPLDLCLSCHDGQLSIPDVMGADANGLEDRSAGFFGPPDVVSRKGHTLGHGLGTRRDGGSACERCHGAGRQVAAVTCIDCHDPHGNGVARNLRWPSNPEATPALGLFVDPSAGGMRRYESASVSYGTLDGAALREVSSLCTDCHHGFTGPRLVDRDGNGRHDRHPSYDSERGSTNVIDQGRAPGTTAPTHWERGRGSGFDGTTRVRVVVRGATDFAGGRAVSAGRSGVFCLTCHKAHGSSQPFGLAWPAEDGLTAVGCDQCHNVADATPPSLAGRAPSASTGAGGSPSAPGVAMQAAPPAPGDRSAREHGRR